jgi:hypothetical protein
LLAQYQATSTTTAHIPMKTALAAAKMTMTWPARRRRETDIDPAGRLMSSSG